MANKINQDIIQKIRKEVKSGKSKLHVSKELNISYKKVLKYTKDLKTKRGIPIELRDLIRKDVKSGVSKRQVAIMYGVSENTVCYYTRDICLCPFGKLRVQDRKLELLKDLFKNGYAFSSKKYQKPEYNKLKKHFPEIYKVKMYGRVIFYLKDKKDVAIRAFLENSQRKIISYQELKQVSKVFDTKLDLREKRQIIEDNRSKKLFRIKS